MNLSKVMIEETESSSVGSGLGFTLFKPGPEFGITAEFQIDRNFIFETGLNLSSWGYKNYYEQVGGTPVTFVDELYNLCYLNIPVTAKPVFSVGKVRFYGAFGPYFSFGVFGNITTKTTSENLPETEVKSIKWGSEEGYDDFSMSDYGLRFGTGIMFRSVQMGFSYNLGLADITPYGDAASVLHNRVVGVSLGVMFGKRNSYESRKDQSRHRTRTEIARNEATLQPEKARQEQIRTDSLERVRTEENERLIIEIEQADSIADSTALAAKMEAEKLRLEKARADSIARTRAGVVYRVQFASTTTSKGSYEITIGGRKYKTWEYFYQGAYRSTVGEFKTYSEAAEFLNLVRQSGYKQSFLAAFRNNVRDLNPDLFK